MLPESASPFYCTVGDIPFALDRQALLRTLADADAALYAKIGIDLPALLCAVDRDRAVRADLHAKRTVYAGVAFFRIIVDFLTFFRSGND